MRTILLTLLICFQVTLQAVCSPCQTLDNGTGKPSEALLEVLEVFCIQHDGSWPSIQQATEEAWLAHGRNVNIVDIPPVVDTSPERTYSLFTRLAMTQTLSPQLDCYDYAAVLGTMAQDARSRLWFLKKAWDQGVRFSTLVLLTGDRQLDPKMESEKILFDPACCPYPFRAGWKAPAEMPANETEMMRLVFDQLELPEEWRKMPLVVVDTPKPEGLNRPHTEHTMQAWLAMHPTEGSMIVISTQPFVCRQDAVLRPFLPPDFEMETVGAGFSFEKFEQYPNATAMLLAELAYRIKLYLIASAKTGCACLSSEPCLYER